MKSKSMHLEQQIEQLHGHILALELGLAAALNDVAGAYPDPQEAHRRMVMAFRIFEGHPAMRPADKGFKISLSRLVNQIEAMANLSMATA